MGIDKVVSHDSLPWLATVVSGIGTTFFHEGSQDTVVDRLFVLAYKLHHVTVILHQGQGVRGNGGHYVHTYVVHKMLLPYSLVH